MLIFIGAGVSKIFEIPDMRGFIEIFDNDPQITQFDIYEDIKRTFGNDIDLEILMTILDDLSKDRKDFLKSISPQTTQFILRNINTKNYIYDDEVIDKSKFILGNIKNILRNECRKAEFEYQDKILDVYDRFLETICRYVSNHYTSGDKKISYPNNLKFVTTNYDRCIETFLRKRQIQFVQGLVNKFGHLTLDVSSFNDGSNRVGLFKLHGSIDLFTIDGMIRRKIYEEESGLELVYYPVEFSGYQHIIESPYLELFYLFRERLNQEDTWIIIGSSLRDRTICSIMNDVIRLKTEGEYPKIIFVNPEVGIIPRLKDWGFPYLADRVSQNHIRDYFGSDETNKKILEHLTRNVPT